MTPIEQMREVVTKAMNDKSEYDDSRNRNADTLKGLNGNSKTK